MSTTAVREYGVCMRDWQVRALLDGSKTQHRVPVKPQPPFGCYYAINGAYSHALCMFDKEDGTHGFVHPTPTSKDHRLPSPHGTVGDRWWVKEAWSPDHRDFYPHFPVVYQADETVGKDDIPEGKSFVWYSGAMMRRYHSRITLEVTGVRVQRLSDMTEDDAIAEGVVRPVDKIVKPGSVPIEYMPIYHRDIYLELHWPRTHGKKPGLSVDDNPWVWVYEFKRLEVNQDA